MVALARSPHLDRWPRVAFRALPTVLAVVALLAATRARTEELIDVDLAAPAHALPHFWEQAFGSGRAALSLRDQYRADLRVVHAATGFGYARFHGILHDENGVYDEDEAGHPLYNFSSVDQIYDGLLANGVRPLVEIGFMPRKLAARQDVHPFWYKPIVAPPKDWDRWDGLIEAFARHLVDRYGIDEVAQWYFEVWNEPNLDFWTGEPKQATYFELYDHTARALKAVSAHLRVGGPATSSAHWVPEFLAHAAAAGTAVDFVSTHGYADDTVEDLFGTQDPIPVEERVCRAAAKVRREIDASPRPGLPLFWTEWNVASFGQEIRARDSAYVGAGLASTISQCDGLVQMLAWWTFSDVFEENGPGRRPFDGSFGLVGLGGIQKPALTAFTLLHRLGTERLDTAGRDVLVTRRADGTPIVAIWNLQDPAGASVPRSVALRIDGAGVGQRWQATMLDDEHGSSRAASRAIGSPRYPTRRQVADLNRAAVVPAPHRVAAALDGRIHLVLAPNALVLLEPRPTRAVTPAR